MEGHELGTSRQKKAHRQQSSEASNVGRGKNQDRGGGHKKEERPRREIPFPQWLAEVLQWAHTLMMVKWLVIALLVDGPALTLLWLGLTLLIGSLVLERLKTGGGRQGEESISTMTNAMLCLRLTQGLAITISLVCESIHAPYLAHWASSHAISFLVVVAGVAVSTGDSKSWHYIMVIAWELILLPTAAWLELSNTSIRHVLHVPVQHRYAILLLPLAVALRGLDPLSFKARNSRLKVNARLKVPWDPALY